MGDGRRNENMVSVDPRSSCEMPGDTPDCGVRLVRIIIHTYNRERLEYLGECPEIWPEMGRAGRTNVEANYDIGRLNDRLVAIYQGLLNGTNRAK